MEAKLLPIGITIQTWDDDDKQWFDTIITKIEDGIAYLELIDPDSDWQGMEWDEPVLEVKWRTGKY